jgi:hypothetical protein
MLDGLKKRGFKLSDGIEGSGFVMLANERAGGYYFGLFPLLLFRLTSPPFAATDVGASQLIIDGKIKLKNDSLLKEFTENGLRFEDGSELEADVVLFATGFFFSFFLFFSFSWIQTHFHRWGDARDTIRRICGSSVAAQCSRIWGMDQEGEMNGCWRDLGVEGLWYMVGNLALCRFHSKHLALRTWPFFFFFSLSRGWTDMRSSLEIKAQLEGVFGTRYVT